MREPNGYGRWRAANALELQVLRRGARPVDTRARTPPYFGVRARAKQAGSRSLHRRRLGTQWS